MVLVAAAVPIGMLAGLALANEPVRLVPTDEPYPLYLAGWQQPRSGFSVVMVPEPQLPESGSLPWGIALGDRFGILEATAPNGARLQLGIEAGWIAQFDVAHTWDVIGWDGLYGVYLAWAAPSRLAVRLAVAHDSAHVGDEYLLRTRYRRLLYTREEVRLGASYFPAANWRLYAEGGVAPGVPNENVDRWRVETGAELVSKPVFLGRFGGFSAVDWTLFDLDETPGTITARAGLYWPQPELTVRWVVGYSGGRLPLSEFRALPERVLSISLEAER